jgi:WD40 repeat protein
MGERPYKGLMPYDEADAPFFFGREAEAEIISANLMASRLTLLYGLSGVGKSSVLRAGVVRHLRALAGQNFIERGTPEFAVVVFSAWRDDPIAALAAEVERGVSSFLAGQRMDEPERGKGSLVEILRFWGEQIDGDLLIILDQFEEYFLYHSQEDGEGSFAVEFPRAINRQDLRASFLISVREDALAKLDRFKGRIPGLFDNYLRVDHLDRTAARSAIEMPIAEYNRLRKNGGEVSIEPELVDAILDQVKTGQVMLGTGGRGVVEGTDESRIETPYLQLVMTRLWHEEIEASHSPCLRLSTLERLGGAERIVRTHLDTTMSALPPDEQDAAARIFRYLVTPSGTKIAHGAGDLAEYAQVSPSRIEPILEKLSSTGIRILRPVAPPLGQPGLPRYEIFHDVLAGAIVDWRARYGRAQELAEAEAARVDSERRLIEERAEADRKLADARHRAHKLRLGMIGLSLMLLLMIGLAAFAFQQRSMARRAQTEAVSQRLTAEKAQTEAVSQRFAAEKAQSEAVAQRVAAQEAEAEAVSQRAATEKARANEIAQRMAAEKAQTEAVAQRDNAETARIDAETQRQLAISRELSAAALNGLEANPERSLLLSLHAVSATTSRGKPVLREAEEALHRAVQASRLQLTLGGAEGGAGGMASCASVAFSPDGTRVATAARGAFGAGKVWDASTGKELLALYGHAGRFSRVVFSPDGKRLATAGADNTAKVWDAATGKELLTLSGHSDSVNGLAFGPDGKRLATAGDDKTARVWDAATGKVLLTLSGHDGRISRVVFSPDGKRLATAGDDKTAKVWDAVTGRELLTLSGHDGRISGLAFGPDGKRLATAADDGTAKVWDAQSGQQLITLFRTGESSNAIAFDTGGTRLVTGYGDGVTKVWDAATGRMLVTLSGEASPVWDVTFSPDGKRVATAGDDGTARVWDVSPAGGPEWFTLVPAVGPVLDVAYSPDGRQLATACGLSVKVWNAASGRELRNLSDQAGRTFSIAFSPDGGGLATRGDQATRVWDVETDKVLLALPTQLQPSATVTPSGIPTYGMAFSPDGKRLATAGRDGSTRIWDAATGKALVTLPGQAGTTYSVAFSPDGTRLATGTAAATQLLDAATGKALVTLPGQAGTTYSVAFSGDGRRVAAGRMDKMVKVWDLVTGQILFTFTGHRGIVHSVTFSPDGRRLATASADGTVKLWDVSNSKEAGRDPLTLSGHSGAIYKVTFSPDGRRLATASEDGTARIYALPIEDLVKIAKSRVTRSLTVEECGRFLHTAQCPPTL